jgi:hypothetical protein
MDCWVIVATTLGNADLEHGVTIAFGADTSGNTNLEN